MSDLVNIAAPVTAAPVTAAPVTAAPVITVYNATKLVNLYFKSKQMTLNASAPSKFCILWGNDNYSNSKAGTSCNPAGPDAYNIFWAIRLLADTENYDLDDIEYHVKHNPILSEINAGNSLNRLNQVHLLRSAIKTYKREAEKVQQAEKKALAAEKERAAYIDATISNSAAGYVRSLILTHSIVMN